MRWEDMELLGVFLPRLLWPLGKTHLTAYNGANLETISPFPFSVKGEGVRRLLTLLGRKNEAHVLN